MLSGKYAVTVSMLTSAAFLLASCGTEGSQNGTASPISSTKSSLEIAKAEPGDSLAIDYTLKLDDGTVFDTTVPEMAQKSLKYDPKRTYSPLLARLGAGQVPV